MAGKTHAVGQLQGYILQVRHMLFELISLDDIVVSIEKFDDVAVESSDGSVIAEQIKSVTSDNNPTTDRSVAFWKTLYNWFHYIRNNNLVLEKTVFRMVVVSNRELGVGGVINAFDRASTKEDAQEVLRTAKLNLWGENNELKGEIPVSCGQYLDVLFSDDNEELVSQIITKFELDIHEKDYDEKLVKKFNAHALSPEFEDNLLVHMLGWVNNEVNEYTKQGLPAFISSVDYSDALIAQRRMYDQRNAIPAISTKITSDAAHTEVEKQDVYIRQLDFIELGFNDKLEAASDYLQTRAETILRAGTGVFSLQNLQDHSDKLRRLWKSKHSQVSRLRHYSDIEKGQQLYAETGESVIQFTLADAVLPSFFGSGTLHGLANEPREEPVIGWHPNYKDLLKGYQQSE